MDVIHRRFSLDDLYRMMDAGILVEGERVELIEGEILALSPHNPEHSNAVEDTTSILVRAFGPSYGVRVQLPLELDDYSEPEPDFAVVAKGSPRGKRHPRTAALVIEVSNTPLRFDRGRKAGVYARAGIADYWILNVTDRQLEVYRDADPATGLYRTRTVLTQEDQAEPLALPGVFLAVRDLFGYSIPE